MKLLKSLQSLIGGKKTQRAHPAVSSSRWHRLYIEELESRDLPSSLTVFPAALAIATANSPYSATITATGGSGTYDFAVSYGSIPSWLTLNRNTGALSGTPTTTGTYSFNISAVDSSNSGLHGYKSYTLSVNAASSLTVSPPALASATANSAYTADLIATGGSGSYTFAVSAGTLPSWLKLNTSTGVLSGTPTTTGTSTFTITATDRHNTAPPRQHGLHADRERRQQFEVESGDAADCHR